MGESARVRSIDSMADLRTALIEFSEAGRSALADADSEIRRFVEWLQHDRGRYWGSQIRERTEKVSQAQADLFRAKIGAESTARECFVAEKALSLAQRRLEEARRKAENVRVWTRAFDREAMLYEAQVQALSTALYEEMPRATERLGRMIHALQAYAAVAPPVASGGEHDPERSNLPGLLNLQGDVSEPAGIAGEREIALRAFEQVLDEVRAAAPDDESRGSLPITKFAATLTREMEEDSDVQAIVESLELARYYAGLSERVVVRGDALSKRFVYLVRCEVESVNDSGWFIADASSGDHLSALTAYRVSNLLKNCPDLRSVLSLPPGHIVLMDRSAILAVFGLENDAVWRRESESTGG